MFSALLRGSGPQPENLVYSDFTSEELYQEGAKRGAIDPCFPSKLGIPHVHNLLFVQHAKKPLDMIFFPMIDDLHQRLENCSRPARLPDRRRDARSRQGRVHQGRRSLQGEGRRVPRSLRQPRDKPLCLSARCTRRSRTSWGSARRKPSRHSGWLTRHSTTSTVGHAREQRARDPRQAGARRRLGIVVLGRVRITTIPA